MRDIILTTVNIHPGIRGVELKLKVMDIVNPVKFDINEFNKELESLVQSNEIIELKYIIPSIGLTSQIDRTRYIYFPKETQIRGIK